MSEEEKMKEETVVTEELPKKKRYFAYGRLKRKKKPKKRKPSPQQIQERREREKARKELKKQKEKEKLRLKKEKEKERLLLKEQREKERLKLKKEAQRERIRVKKEEKERKEKELLKLKKQNEREKEALKKEKKEKEKKIKEKEKLKRQREKEHLRKKKAEAEKRRKEAERERIKKEAQKIKEKQKEKEEKKKEREKEKRCQEYTEYRRKYINRWRRRKTAANRRRRKNAQWQRKYNHRKRKEHLKELRKNHDKESHYMIIVMEKDFSRSGENYTIFKRKETLKRERLMSKAHSTFDEYVRKNREEVIGHFTKRVCVGKTTEIKEYSYEIVLIENIRKSTASRVANIKEKGGKYIKNIVIDSYDHVILKKAEWYLPETYCVYGFNPNRKKFTGKWIYDNILMKDVDNVNTKLVFTMNNNLYIQTALNTEFVICKTKDDADILYNDMLAVTKKNKYILFVGRKEGRETEYIRDRLIKEYGIPRNFLYL